MDKSALIIGITGQDGSYLAEFLITQGYTVHGLVRRSSTFGTQRVDHLYVDSHVPSARLFLHYGDLADASSLARLIQDIRPDEVYNLGAQSHVDVSFVNPVYTADIVAVGTLRVLEALRMLDYPVRFYQASSSEMFGRAAEVPQNEKTPFHPRSPYGVAKVFSYHQTVNYREAYGHFACNGILFNHESPRRGETFVTRKVTRAATRIKLGLQETVYLGNLEAERDWGFAGDYVTAMWAMLQQDEPDDFVIATGKRHSVRSLCAVAFGLLDLDWQDHVAIDEDYIRPSEVDVLEGDASKAQRVLGWEPKVDFEGLIQMMIDADLELARQEHTLLSAGFKANEWHSSRGF